MVPQFALGIDSFRSGEQAAVEVSMSWVCFARTGATTRKKNASAPSLTVTYFYSQLQWDVGRPDTILFSIFEIFYIIANCS